MQESKYFYNGIPFFKYCKDNNVNINTIRGRIWKKRQSNKYKNYTDQENYSDDDLANYFNLTIDEIKQKEIEILTLLKNNDGVKALKKAKEGN